MTGTGHVESRKRTFVDHSSADRTIENIVPIGLFVRHALGTAIGLKGKVL